MTTSPIKWQAPSCVERALCLWKQREHGNWRVCVLYWVANENVCFFDNLMTVTPLSGFKLCRWWESKSLPDFLACDYLRGGGYFFVLPQDFENSNTHSWQERMLPGTGVQLAVWIHCVCGAKTVHYADVGWLSLGLSLGGTVSSFELVGHPTNSFIL